MDREGGKRAVMEVVPVTVGLIPLYRLLCSQYSGFQVHLNFPCCVWNCVLRRTAHTVEVLVLYTLV